MPHLDIETTAATLAEFRRDTLAAARADDRVLVGYRTVAWLREILEVLAEETGRPLATPPENALLTLKDLTPYLGPAETALAALPRLRAFRSALLRPQQDS